MKLPPFKQWQWLLLLPLLAGAGCTTSQSMRYHLAVADADALKPELKFYRITLKTKASNIKATLDTGWYDANAVRQLYGHVPKNAGEVTPGTRLGQHRFLFDPQTGQWQAVDDEQLFTIIYGGDSKAISGKIKAYAQQSKTGEQFGRLLAAAAGKEAYAESVKAEEVEKSGRKQLAQLRAEVEKHKEQAAKLAGNEKPEEVNQLLLKVAQEAAKRLGSTTVFRTDSSTNGFADAKKLLEILTDNQNSNP